MAKKPTKRTKGAARNRTTRSAPQPGMAEYRLRLAALDDIVLTETTGVSWQTFNDTLRSAIDTDAGGYADAVVTLLQAAKVKPADMPEHIRQHVCTAFELGFRMALTRYREHLEHVPELQRRRDTDALRSRKANDARRRLLNLDVRDAAILAEFTTLRATMAAGDAQYALAKKHGVTDKQIRNVLSKARKQK